MKRAILSLLLLGTGLLAQSPKAVRDELNELETQAQAAFNREMAREKAGDCRDANTTYDIVMCLEKANDVTDANYKAYAGAIRAKFAVKIGDDNATEFSGPTGKPATRQENLDSFDQMQAAWEKYRSSVCSIVDGLWRGGTIVNIEVGYCHLMMVRSHMRELAAAYGEYRSH